MTNPLRLDDGSMEGGPTWRHHTSHLEERSHLLLVHFFIGYFSILRIQFYPDKVLILIPCLRTGGSNSSERVKNNTWVEASVTSTVRVALKNRRVLHQIVLIFLTCCPVDTASLEINSLITLGFMQFWTLRNVIHLFPGFPTLVTYILRASSHVNVHLFVSLGSSGIGSFTSEIPMAVIIWS